MTLLYNTTTPSLTIIENIEASHLNEPVTTTEDDIPHKVEPQALFGPDIKPVSTNQADEVESQEDDFGEGNSNESEEDDLGFGDGGHQSEEEELPGPDQQVAEMAADAEEEDDRAIAQAVVGNAGKPYLKWCAKTFR